MGQFARRCASLRRCAGRERGGEQTACVRQKPMQWEFSTFCGSCCGKRKCLPGMASIKAKQKNPRHSRVSAGDFQMGRLARRCASLRQYAGSEWRDKARPPAPGKSPYRESFPPFAAAAVEIGSVSPACRLLKRNKKSAAFQSECRGFFGWGRFARYGASEASGSGKPDQLTPVLSAGTVRGRAGCVKSHSVQTFPHFAGRPVENRGRPGDRKNRLSQWNSRF